MSGFLARRGFEYGTVREVVDRLIHEYDETDRDFFASDEQPEDTDLDEALPNEE